MMMMMMMMMMIIMFTAHDAYLSLSFWRCISCFAGLFNINFSYRHTTWLKENKNRTVNIQGDEVLQSIITQGYNQHEDSVKAKRNFKFANKKVKT